MNDIDLRQYNKWYIFLYCIVFLSVAGWMIADTIITNDKVSKQNLAYHFDDVVEFVYYDIKGIPTVRVNGREYYLSDGYNFDHKIEQGDSIKKLKGSKTYNLTKKHSGKKLFFTN